MPTRKTHRQVRRLVAALFLFQKSLNTEGVADGQTELDKDRTDFSRIRCPLCKWRPDARSRWRCANNPHPENYRGCGTVWNTFDTHGVCPGCGHQWRWTSCLRCHRMSPHEDWYSKDANESA